MDEIKPDKIGLRLACSADKRGLFDLLCDRFAHAGFHLSSGRRVSIQLLEIDEAAPLSSIRATNPDVVCPDSTIVLECLDRSESDRGVAEYSIFTLSPLLFALSPSFAERLGYPRRHPSWDDIRAQVQEGVDLEWAYPHPSTSAGMLSLFARFGRAGDDPIRRIADEPVLLERERDLESKAREYGPSERELIRRTIRGGEWASDVLVAQESLLLEAIAELPVRARPILVEQTSATVWLDHPLALLAGPYEDDDIPEAYQLLRDFLHSPEGQALLLRAGYRPAAASMQAYFEQRPGGDRLRAAFQVPPVGAPVSPTPTQIQAMSGVWFDFKKGGAVYLLADTSSSMSVGKLHAAKRALASFVQRFQGRDDTIGLISFASTAEIVVPLQSLENGGQNLLESIAGLSARGNTALGDAVLLALRELSVLNTDSIRAVVLFTDGCENASSIRPGTSVLNDAHQSTVPIFCLAYGDDAQLAFLEMLSVASGGRSWIGDASSIEAIFDTILYAG